MRQGLNTHISSYRLYSAEGLVSIWYISPLTKLTVNWKLWHKSISPYSITGLFKMIVGVLTTCHTQYTSDRGICIFFISFYGVMSRIRFIFLLFPQVSRNWRYESEPPLKPSPLTCYKQFGTNSIIMLMFVESQRVHIQSTYKVCSKNLECSIK